MIAAVPPGNPFVADEWLGGILGRPAYRYTGPAGYRLVASVARPFLGAGVFAYAKVAVGDITTLHALGSCGFRLIDTNITLAHTGASAAAPAGEYTVRFSEPHDESGVTELARRSFRFSRFHLDPAFPQVLADTVKATWAGNFFRGQRGDLMAIATKGKDVIGFLQCLKAPDGILVIDLFAVDAVFRRQGIARAMIAHAQARTPGIARVRVGTQLANLPSINLFESQGYKVEAAEYVLHYHGKQGPG